MRPTAMLSLTTLLMTAPASAAVPQGPPPSALVTNAVLMCFAGSASSPRSVTIEHLDVAGDVVYGATYEVAPGRARRAANDETTQSVSCRFTSRGTTPAQGSSPHVDEAGARAQTTIPAQ